MLSVMVGQRLILAAFFLSIWVGTAVAQPPAGGSGGTIPAHDAMTRLGKAANEYTVAEQNFQQKYGRYALSESLRTWAAANQPGYLRHGTQEMDPDPLYESSDTCLRIFFTNQKALIWDYNKAMMSSGMVPVADVEYFEKGAKEAIAYGAGIGPRLEEGLEVLRKMAPLADQIGKLREQERDAEGNQERQRIDDSIKQLQRQLAVMSDELNTKSEAAVGMAQKRFLKGRDPGDMAVVPKAIRVRFLVKGPGGLREVPGNRLSFGVRTVAEVEYDHVPTAAHPPDALRLSIPGAEAMTLSLKVDPRTPVRARSDEFVLIPTDDKSGAPTPTPTKPGGMTGGIR